VKSKSILSLKVNHDETLGNDDSEEDERVNKRPRIDSTNTKKNLFTWATRMKEKVGNFSWHL